MAADFIDYGALPVEEAVVPLEPAPGAVRCSTPRSR
jgi:hypothetical protein